jgi:hypothetical protein
MRYRGVSFTLNGSRVCEIIVADPGARTQRGVRIGDSWERARGLYPELRCERAEITGEHPREFSFCSGKTGAGVNLWLGGDPVDSIRLGQAKYPLVGVDP